MKVITVIALAALALLACSARLGAQREAIEGPGAGSNAIEQAIARLEAKIGGLQAQQEKSQRETALRLDKVLANQEQILKEIEVVKVRASLKN